MIGMLAVIFGTKHGSETSAGIGMDLPQETLFGFLPAPSVQNRDLAAIGEHKGKNINCVGKGVLRQIAASVYPAAAIGA